MLYQFDFWIMFTFLVQYCFQYVEFNHIFFWYGLYFFIEYGAHISNTFLNKITIIVFKNNFVKNEYLNKISSCL